jgi:hypothetical protein
MLVSVRGAPAFPNQNTVTDKEVCIMANVNSTVTTVSQEAIKAVNARLEFILLDLIAIHEYISQYSFPQDFGLNETILKTMARSCALDVNQCLIRLGGPNLGYIEDYFGTA